MAKTIMISNKIYEELKVLKGERSFTEVINGLLRKENKMTLGLLFKKYSGIMEGDKEYDKIMKELKEEWKKWTKKYV